MSDSRQVVFGVLAALLSSAVMLGSLSLSMLEGGFRLALAPTPAFTSTTGPSPLPPATLAPGEPTFTPTSTLLPTETATATFPPPACQPPPGWQPINLQPGDTLEGLAQVYGVSSQELAQGNCLITSSLPPAGVLYVPPLPPTATFTQPPLPTDTQPPAPTQTAPADAGPQCGPPPGWVRYVVLRGDTLSALSQKLGVSIAQLQLANCLGSSNTIRVGQSLWVPFIPALPTATPTFAPIPTRTPTFTAQPPTATQPPPPTVAPTHTVVTPTSAPTDTPVPTSAPLPTDTQAPPTATFSQPVPTQAPTATLEPSPTSASNLEPTITSPTETAPSE